MPLDFFPKDVYGTKKIEIIDPENKYYHKVPPQDSLDYKAGKLRKLTSMCGKTWTPKFVNSSTFELAAQGLDPCPRCWPNQAIAA